MRGILSALTVALALVGAPALAADLTLTGVMTGADHQTYREVPFRLPAGVTAVTIEFEYTGKDQKSVIDLGLRDPQRFRGWSGGNKQRFTVSETWATPSYLPGPLPAGEWKLILGVPNLRKDGRAAYTAKVTFERGGAFHGFAAAPLKDGPGWYRGDLHMHTAHSDGSCASRTGKRVPCPVFRTLEAATARGLDFVAVSDHNTTSQNNSLAELQPFFDDLLVIPAREITTFHGHFNIVGPTGPIDFQLGSPRAPTLSAILKQANAAGAFVSVNHPGLPSGEACMGCGWTVPDPIAGVNGIEVVNGTTAEGPLSGLGFWLAHLKTGGGQRLTAVGGSDNHDPDRSPGVSVPTTVVYARNLSQDAILEGLRAGHAFIDIQGTRDRLLEVSIEGGPPAGMGDIVRGKPDQSFQLRIHVAHARGGHVEIVSDRNMRLGSTEKPLASDDETELSPRLDYGAAAWWRVEVRGADGKLWLLGNPVYVDATR